MNHAGNPMSDTVNQPRAFEILTAEPVKKRRKPRDWSDDEKGQLVAETLLPGANVSAIARSAGVDPHRSGLASIRNRSPHAVELQGRRHQLTAYEIWEGRRFQSCKRHNVVTRLLS
jgi:hypothetical protein